MSRNRWFGFSAVLLIALLVGSTAVAAEKTTTLMQEKYKQITSMRSEFTQVLTHKESGKKENRSGTLTFKRPLLVSWVTTSPSEELLIINGKEIWNAFPEEEIAYKYPLSMVEDSRNIIRVITGQSSLDQDFIVDKETRDGGLIKLLLYPHEPQQNMVEATFWVDPSTWLLKRIIVVDFFGNQNDITFLKQEVNVKVHDDVFSFTPPKGMDVEDRTNNSGVMEKPLLQ